MRLTSRGWALTGLTPVLVVAAALFGIEELYALGAAALLLVAGAALWVTRRPWRFRTARQVTPLRVAAGGEARVELAIRNREGRRSPVVTARDRFDGGRRWAVYSLAPLSPGETLRTSYRLPTSERGVFEVGPLELELSDPFGLVSTVRPGAPPSTLTVHPRMVRLAPPHRSTGSETRPPDAAAVIGSDGSELYAVREYRVGDDLRRVHWASSARLGELMIRQDESPQRGRLTVVVDLRRVAWTAGGLETALSAAASVLEAASDDGLLVRLVTSAGTDTGFAVGRSHRAVILDELAGAKPTETIGTRTGDLARLIGSAPGEAVVVVTSDSTAGHAMLGGQRPTRQADFTAILVASERGPAPPPLARAGGGLRVVSLVGGVDALPAVWARAQRGRSREVLY